jgi:lipoprotein-anchoring transpeptidase ErfK/SrfK
VRAAVRHRRRFRTTAALLLSAVTLLTACGGGGDDRPTLDRNRAKETTTTLPSFISFVAQVKGAKIGVYDAPNQADGAAPKRTFENPWLYRDLPSAPVPQVFLVKQQKGDWVEVLLPVRPTGTTGWVRKADVQLTQNRYRVVVELGAHHITVYNGDDVILRETVAIGAPETPTTKGLFYLRVLVKPPDPTTVYGPYAYGLSAYSDVLTSFNGGEGEAGIHGNNDASVLGKDVSHGCIRMSNDGITKLAELPLPLGTPVDVRA